MDPTGIEPHISRMWGERSTAAPLSRCIVLCRLFCLYSTLCTLSAAEHRRGDNGHYTVWTLHCAFVSFRQITKRFVRSRARRDFPPPRARIDCTVWSTNTRTDTRTDTRTFTGFVNSGDSSVILCWTRENCLLKGDCQVDFYSRFD